MCGILGISSSHKLSPAILELLQGLRLLQNRGYDSAGIAVIHPVTEEILCEKYASTTHNNSIALLEHAIERVVDMFGQNARVGIAHTRWATHGEKTDANAHPHLDALRRIAIVHNGIIENHERIRAELIEKGVSFQSQTDSEVIAHLLAQAMCDDPNRNHTTVLRAIRETMTKLEGTFAVVCICIDQPDKVYAFCHGSPLVIGTDCAKGISMVSSELLGFGNHTFEYSFLSDQTIAVLEYGRVALVKADTMTSVTAETKQMSPLAHLELEFDHSRFGSWLEKEIFEQPDSMTRAFNHGGRFDLHTNRVKLGGLERHTASLLNAEHLLMLGCGTSFYAGLHCMSVFRRLTSFQTVSIVDGAEFEEIDLPKRGTCVAVLLSQSGETKDLHRCLAILEPYRTRITTIGVVNVVESMIARSVDCGVYLNAGREVSVASTKSFTSMVMVLHLIAVWFAQQQIATHDRAISQILSDMAKLPAQTQQVLSCPLERPMVDYLYQTGHSSMFILGRGPNEAIALEGSLKWKEVGYLHAEGKSAASLKHGPFALIDGGLPIVCLHSSSDGSGKMWNLVQEVCARDSRVFVLSDDEDLPATIASNEKCTVCRVPSNYTFSGLLEMVVLQKAVLSLAYARGYDPDFPRNLAKVVTVE